MREMEKKTLSLVIMLVLVTGALALSGCTTEEPVQKIIVGTSADFPPFEYKDDDGNIIGFDIDLIKALLQNLNYTVEVQDIAFDSLIPSLQAGSIDVIAAAMTITAEREEQVDFTNAYYEADQSILIKSGQNLTINSTDDLWNLTIGAQTGTTGAAWVQENLIEALNMSEDYLKLYELYIDAVQDLDIGSERLDAIILDQPVAQAFAANANREIAYVIITGENYGFAVRNGETDLVAGINQELQTYMNSDAWTTLINTYFE